MIPAELVAFVFAQATPAMQRGALLVLSLSDGDVTWSVVPPGSDLDLDDVRDLHAKAGGGVEVRRP